LVISDINIWTNLSDLGIEWTTVDGGALLLIVCFGLNWGFRWQSLSIIVERVTVVASWLAPPPPLRIGPRDLVRGKWTKESLERGSDAVS
jgi:hypothetical protein